MPHLYIDIAEALGDKGITSADQAVDVVLGSIRKLSSDVGIPKNLKELVSRSYWLPPTLCLSCRWLAAAVVGDSRHCSVPCRLLVPQIGRAHV